MSLFSGKAKSNENIQEKRTDSVAIPDAEPHAKRILEQAQRVYGKSLVNPFTKRQQDVFKLGDAGKGLGQRELGEARKNIEKGAQDLSAFDRSAYMNPYIRQVIQENLNDQDLNFRRSLKDMDLQAAQSGGLDGDINRVMKQKAQADYDRNRQRILNEGLATAFDRSYDFAREDRDNAKTSANGFLNLSNHARQYEDEDYKRQLFMSEMDRLQKDKEIMSEADNLMRYSGLLNQVSPNLRKDMTTGQQRSYNLSNKGHRPWNTLLSIANMVNRQHASSEEEQAGGGSRPNGGGGGGGLGSLFGGFGGGGGESQGGGGFLNTLAQLLSPRQYAPQQTTSSYSSPWAPPGSDRSVMFRR